MSENPTETKAARAANPGPPPEPVTVWDRVPDYGIVYVTADEMREYLNLELLPRTFRNTYADFVRASEASIAMTLLGKTLGMHSPSRAEPDKGDAYGYRRAAIEITAAQRGPFADARRAAIAAFCETVPRFSGAQYQPARFAIVSLVAWLEHFELLRGGLTRPSDAALRATAGEGPSHYAALAAYERARSSKRETVDRTRSHPGAPNRQDLPRLAEQQRAKSAEKTFAADQGFGGFVQRERIET